MFNDRLARTDFFCLRPELRRLSNLIKSRTLPGPGDSRVIEDLRALTRVMRPTAVVSRVKFIIAQHDAGQPIAERFMELMSYDRVGVDQGLLQ